MPVKKTKMPAKTTPGMRRTRKPWAAKLRPEMEPQVVPDPKGRGKLLLPTPLLVAAEISAIPSGSLLTVSQLRLRLARQFGADLACPLMTGIFYNIIAGSAEEQLSAGQQALAPYWRVILDNGTLSPKTPAGPQQQAKRLRQEGHAIGRRRDKLVVKDFGEHLAE